MKLTFDINTSLYDKNRWLFVTVIFTVIGFISCKKDTSELDQLVKDMSGYDAIHYEVGESMDLYGTLYNTVTSYVNVPIEINSTAVNDTVFAIVDPTLVSSFNQLYNENNIAIPDSAFKASNNGVFPIANGKSYSFDSLFADLNDASLLTDSTTYLVPIRLKEKQSNGLKYSVVFFKLKYYLKGGLYAYPQPFYKGNSSTNSYGFVFATYKAYFMSGAQNVSVLNLGETIKLPVALSTVFKNHDLMVSAELAYNDSAMQTISTNSLLGYPENTLQMTKSSVTIPAGSLISKDSLEVIVPSGMGSLFSTYKSYQFIIQLKEYSDINNRVPLKAGVDRVVYSIYMYP